MRCDRRHISDFGGEGSGEGGRTRWDDEGGEEEMGEEGRWVFEGGSGDLQVKAILSEGILIKLL